MDDDKVFKALADAGRRALLDRLSVTNGQTLRQLCESMAMTRQSVTQHLGLLEAANLISTLRRGREKLHFVNAVPLHDIYERWVRKFETPRLTFLYDLKKNLEGEAKMTNERTSFIYVTFITSTPEKVFEAITSAELSSRYWGHANVSDWAPGSRWEHVRNDEARTVNIVGKVIEHNPPSRLVLSWVGTSSEADPQAYSRVTFDIAPYDGTLVKLTVTHDDLIKGSGMEQGVSRGWPIVLSSLKSFLETGQGLNVFAKPKAA